MLGMKTRPWKFNIWPAARHDLPAPFERTILRRKTPFLGPLKSSKNMHRKSILIGLFVLSNNRTISEPKSLQGGWESQFSPRANFRAVMGGTGKWRGFSHGRLQAAQASMG